MIQGHIINISITNVNQAHYLSWNLDMILAQQNRKEQDK